jgi:YVTN family beta-propeller protein
LSVSTDPRIGTEVLGYRIEALLGRGGMGVVYRAYDPRLKRSVALKLVVPELAADTRFRERFLAESELAASLEHPNVVPVHDAGEVDGQLAIAMRYVAGSDLKTLLREQGALPPARAIAICAQVADALDAAHERGLVHRDVKPSNVLLDQREHVYLADFGLTRRLAEHGLPVGEGLSLGTPAYAAPEQIQAEPVDGRADVYSLGCLLYECLTGEVPFARESELALLWAHLEEQPPRPSERNPALPKAIDAVIAKALAKEPGQRYQTCGELTEAAREALGVRDVVLVRDRKPLAIAALGALIAAGAVAAGLLLILGDGSATKPSLAVANNTLVRIDPEADRIAAVTKVGGGPESVAVGGETVWVYNWEDRTVSAIDATTNLVERTVSISGFPPFVPANSIAADATGAWVLSHAAGKGALTHLRPGLRPREFAFAYDPVSIAVGEGAVWVAAKSIRGSFVLRIRPSTGSVLSTVALRGAAINPESQFRDVRSVAAGERGVWALQGGTIFRIDPATARITGRVNLPSREVAQVGAGNGAVWALVLSPTTGNQLVRVDPRTLRVTSRIRAPRIRGSASAEVSFSGDFALGDGDLWWNGGAAGTVWRVDPGSGRIESTIRITRPLLSFADSHPHGIAAGAGGVWVAVRVAP